MLPRALRAGAVVIAILGVIDPRITWTRPVAAIVAVVDTTPAGTAGDQLADRVVRGLEGSFTVVRRAFPGVAAVVAVGDRPPRGVGDDGAPGFAVVREPLIPAIEIAGVAAPARAPLDTRVPIDATVRVAGAKGQKIEVTLSSGDLIIDRAAHDVATDAERFTAALTFVPATEGLARLRVTAGAAGAAGAAVDVAIDVRRQPWFVLVFDGHPSWASTFVRRALEHDARFSVTTRLDTSRDAATSIGQPPASLASLDALLAYDAIVIGGLDELTPADISGLEAFARRRAGAIVAILDRAPTAKFAPLLRVARWTESTNSAALAIDATAPAQARLQASELIWPDALPPGAETLATVPIAGATRAVVWRIPLGAGRVIVSGALDAWRTRASAASTFDEYWRAIVADAAEASPPPLALSVEPALAVPGETLTVRATLRDLVTPVTRSSGASPSVHGSIAARLEGPDGSTPIRLWPDGEIGRWRGLARAPSAPAAYRVVTESGALTASAPMRVASFVAVSEPEGRDQMRAWAASRGGSTVSASHASDTRDLVGRALTTTSAPQTWRPLRSPWWIMPFALLLGGEWWWRRRRGLR